MVAILALILAVVIPQFSKSRESQVLKSAVSDTVSYINKAKSQTLSSVDSSAYGVHFQSDQVIIFKGTVFSAGSADNEITNILTPATISNVTLGGVSSTSGELYFNRLSGAPNKTGTVTITANSSSKIITISATGTVSIN